MWDNPERNLFLYDAWVKAMNHYFLLSRRRHANGNPIDWPEDEKMALALLAGGMKSNPCSRSWPAKLLQVTIR